MERKLIDYLPPVLRGYAEFRGITAAQQAEFQRAWAEADILMDRQFFDTMDEVGLRRWERMLQITPRGTDTLAVRRARLQARFNLQRPYTLPWLRLWLAGLLGPDAFCLEVTDYTAALELDYDQIPEAARLVEEAKTTLLAVLPENLLLETTTQRQAAATITIGCAAEQAILTEVWPRVVSRRETDARLAVSAAVELHQIIDLSTQES